MKFESSSYCIPVRNASRPVISDAFYIPEEARGAGGTEDDGREENDCVLDRMSPAVTRLQKDLAGNSNIFRVIHV